MKSTTISHLTAEHRTLERLLRAFEALVAVVERDQPVPRSDIAMLVDYLNDLSYLRHEEKEKTMLLPALQRLGLDWNYGLLPRVRQEYRMERYLFRSLRQSALQSSDWSVDDRQHFLSVAREFIAVYRNHMRMEEDQLFPLAEPRLANTEVDAALAGEFTKLDHELRRVPGSEDLRQRGESVAEKYFAR